LNLQPNAHRFSYHQTTSDLQILPLLPFTLLHRSIHLEVEGLLDTGASVNVLPYEFGVQLGLNWAAQTKPVQLTGNLNQAEAKGVVLTAQIADDAPIRLAFAWTEMRDVPLILGQVNFFMHYDVCFYQAESTFEIKPNRKT
jgi:hypothetical protein